jgi:hypothetical protein
VIPIIPAFLSSNSARLCCIHDQKTNQKTIDYHSPIPTLAPPESPSLPDEDDDDNEDDFSSSSRTSSSASTPVVRKLSPISNAKRIAKVAAEAARVKKMKLVAEQTKTRDIREMVPPTTPVNSQISYDKVLSESKTAPREERKYIRNKKTNEIFAYWDGNRAIHIETQKVLFTRGQQDDEMREIKKGKDSKRSLDFL